MNNGLTFLGNSPHRANIFKIEKNIIRITTDYRSTDSYRDLFMNLKTLPLQSQYTLSLLLFVVNNKNKFPLNSNVYNASTRQKCNFR